MAHLHNNTVKALFLLLRISRTEFDHQIVWWWSNTVWWSMASIHHYFAWKQVGDTRKRGKPEMRSSCRNSLDLHWSPWPRPGHGSASVPHLRYLSVSRHFNEETSLSDDLLILSGDRTLFVKLGVREKGLNHVIVELSSAFVCWALFSVLQSASDGCLLRFVMMPSLWQCQLCASMPIVLCVLIAKCVWTFSFHLWTFDLRVPVSAPFVHTDSLSHSPVSFPVFLVSLLLFLFMVSFWMPGLSGICSPFCFAPSHALLVFVFIIKIVVVRDTCIKFVFWFGVDISQRLWICG